MPKSPYTMQEMIKKTNDPVGFAIEQIERAQEESEKKLTSLIEVAKKDFISILDEKIKQSSQRDEELIGRIAIKVATKMAGLEKGVDYFDGETPTDEELIALIKPLIPAPIKGEDGKSPTKEDLLKIIKPLIKPGKDGETPTDERLISLIQKVMPNLGEDTPEKIADKLNTLDEKVNMSVIKGLADKFKTFQNLLKERKSAPKSGGGMGNVVHETTAISSATTTITTAQKIAANGNALWVYYQNGFIVKGTDYTVGGDRKTLTLLFTPQDSTNINIVYVRA